MKADKGKPHIYPKKLYFEFKTDKLCNCGCNQQARYISVKNKKLCCNDHPNKCPAKIKKIAEKKSQINELTGKNSHQVAAEKSLLTRKQLGITKISQIKGAATRKASNHYEKLANVMQKKWESEPWANRLRANFKVYKNTNLSYQGTHELAFLESLENKHGLEWVSQNVRRGIPFWYISTEQKRRLYLPDFLIENTLYEIKSAYTWKKNFENNKRKLNEALNRGYKVKLVLNKNELNYTTTTTIDMDGKIQTA